VAAAHALVDLVRARLGVPDRARPFLVGIAGPVAVGKSVLARELQAALAHDGHRVEVVSTDGFLLPNAVLGAAGLEGRKGFPETYDTDRMASFLTALRAGRSEIHVPVYSHEHYDVVSGETLIIRDPDVVVIEGVNALQPPLVDELDLAVYVDADEPDVLAWYVERFELLRAGDLDAHPFYRRFAAVGAGDLRELAELVWAEVNGPNLREHILPSRAAADVVVRKGADHRVESVSPTP
jgi:type I pantothenate kinase